VADANGSGSGKDTSASQLRTNRTEQPSSDSWASVARTDGKIASSDMADAMCQRRAGLRDELGEPGSSGQGRADCPEDGDSWWTRDPAEPSGTTEPELGRVAHGVAYRVDRLRAIGNGQVPAVAAMAWTILTGPK